MTGFACGRCRRSPDRSLGQLGTHRAEAKGADPWKWESPWGPRIAFAKCDVRFYIIGEPWDYTDAINDFHPMGAPIADGSAVKWHEVPAADSADEYISPLWEAGDTNTSPQPWCADPITCPPDVYGEQVTTKGYVTTAHLGLRHHNVVGGFEYQRRSRGSLMSN